MLKKVTFCVIAILGGASALAAHGNDMPLPTASGVDLIAPHQEGSWTFGVQANYFEANNDFNYAFLDVTTANGFGDDDQFKTYMVGPDYNWGWGVDVTYHFPGDGRDVTLAFTQLNSSESNSTSVVPDDGVFLTGTGAFLSDADEVDSFGNAYTDARGKTSTDYDAVDLTFGQVIDIGNRVTLHPFAGLRYGYINYKATGQYQFQEDGEPVTEDDTQTLKSKFQGVGPRLGSDAAVNLGRGFSLNGTLGVSLLAGSMNTSNSYNILSYNDDSVLTGENYGDYDTSPGTRVVPEADAKLSAMYHTLVDNGYSVGFEVGYQVTNYFDAVQNTSFSQIDTTLGYTNFFMQGPYARVQLDVA